MSSVLDRQHVTWEESLADSQSHNYIKLSFLYTFYLNQSAVNLKLAANRLQFNNFFKAILQFV